MIARNQGALATARSHLERLVAKRPDSARGLNLLGVVLQEQGDANGALSAFERALILDPNFREPLVNAGLLAAAAGDRPTALRYLAHLAALDPGTTSAEERALAEALGNR